jgi:integrase
MQARLFRRSGSPYWQACYTGSNGYTFRESTGLADREQAERYAKQRAAAAADSAAHKTQRPASATPESHTVDAALSRLLSVAPQSVSAATVHCYSAKAGHLSRLLGRFDVNALNIDTMQDYCTIRTGEGAAAESVRKELVTLRRALKLARQRQHLTREIAEIMPPWRVRYVPIDRWLAPAEFELLLEHLSPKRRLWALAAVYTGARRSELQGLQWQGIDWGRALLRIRGTKTKGSHRLVPLHPRLAAALQPHKRDLGLILAPWQNVIRDLAVACQACGLHRVTPNDLRRTFASWLKQAGQDSFVVAQLLGHSSSRMVELVYGRLDTATLTAAVSKLPTS